MYLTLYRKYRPKNFNEIAGEKHIIKTIKNSLKENRFSHAYLFSGPRGVGKTTLARIIAKGLNCKTNGITDTPCNKCENCNNIDGGNFIDLIEIDAASNRGINEIRKLKDKINYKPAQGRKKVYIIDEVHMLTTEAFNALLKTLEEPPEFVVFILATTEPEKILSTIISRCQRFDFYPVSFEEAKDRIDYIINEEKIDVDNDSLKIIHEKSGGSLRDMISLLEKVSSSYHNEKITIEKTNEALGLISTNIIKEFIDIIINNDFDGGIKFFKKVWLEGINSDNFLRELSEYLKNNIANYTENLGIERCLEIIETTYDVLSKFKFEEDKKLAGLVFMSKILKKSNLKNKNIEIVEKKPSKTNTIVEEKKVEIKSPINIDIQEIRQKWSKIITHAKQQKISMLALLTKTKPEKLENNTLFVRFPETNRYHLETLKKRPNYSILKEAFRIEFNVEVEFNFVINDNRQQNDSEDNIVKEVAEFFQGEIIN